MTYVTYIVDNPEEALIVYINDNLDWICPFHVNKGYRFTISIKAEVFESLPKNVQNTFRKKQYVETTEWDEPIPRPYADPTDEEGCRRWTEENYWTNSDTYIFTFMAKGYSISVKEKYNIAGECETDWVTWFISLEGIPFIAWVNRNTSPTFNDFVYPKNGKVYLSLQTFNVDEP